MHSRSLARVAIPVPSLTMLPHPQDHNSKPSKKAAPTPHHASEHKAKSHGSRGSPSGDPPPSKRRSPPHEQAAVEEWTGGGVEADDAGSDCDDHGDSCPFNPNPHRTTIKHPEFVYGGTWGRRESAAKLTRTHVPSPACHATTLVNMPGGDTLAAWFGGMYESAEDVAIYVARRSNAGVWSEPIKAAKVHRNVPYNGKHKSREPSHQGGEPHWNPVLFCEGSEDAPDVCTGEVVLFFKVGWKIPKWQTFVTRSRDGGLTWDEAKELVPGDAGGRGPVKNKPILLSNGNWLAPASLEGPAGWEGRQRPWRGFTDTSEDKGYTWTSSNLVVPPSTHEGIIQPTLWESEPGRVHMMLRSMRGRNAKVWRADSEDYGKTWGKPYKTSLPNNNSGLDVARLPHSGTLVLLYNPTTQDRYPLRVGVSKDNGKTWPIHIDLEKESGAVSNGHEFSYPAVIPWPASEDEEGVSITYTWNRKRPAFFSISLKDIEARARAPL